MESLDGQVLSTKLLNQVKLPCIPSRTTFHVGYFRTNFPSFQYVFFIGHHDILQIESATCVFLYLDYITYNMHILNVRKYWDS